jgi:hypothetical protein
MSIMSGVHRTSVVNAPVQRHPDEPERAWPAPGAAGRGQPQAAQVCLVLLHRQARHAAGLARRVVADAWTYPQRHTGRQRLDQDEQLLIVRLVRENPRGGYQRIQGELLHLVSTTTTIIVRTGRSGWSRRIHPPVGTSSARVSKVRSAAAIGSAVSSMSTAELHERISAPHGLRRPLA